MIKPVGQYKPGTIIPKEEKEIYINIGDWISGKDIPTNTEFYSQKGQV